MRAVILPFRGLERSRFYQGLDRAYYRGSSQKLASNVVGESRIRGDHYSTPVNQHRVIVNHNNMIVTHHINQSSREC